MKISGILLLLFVFCKSASATTQLTCVSENLESLYVSFAEEQSAAYQNEVREIQKIINQDQFGLFKTQADKDLALKAAPLTPFIQDQVMPNAIFQALENFSKLSKEQKQNTLENFYLMDKAEQMPLLREIKFILDKVFSKPLTLETVDQLPEIAKYFGLNHTELAAKGHQWRRANEMASPDVIYEAIRMYLMVHKNEVTASVVKSKGISSNINKLLGAPITKLSAIDKFKAKFGLNKQLDLFSPEASKRAQARINDPQFNFQPSEISKPVHERLTSSKGWYKFYSRADDAANLNYFNIAEITLYLRRLLTPKPADEFTWKPYEAKIPFGKKSSVVAAYYYDFKSVSHDEAINHPENFAVQRDADGRIEGRMTKSTSILCKMIDRLNETPSPQMVENLFLVVTHPLEVQELKFRLERKFPNNHFSWQK